MKRSPLLFFNVSKAGDAEGNVLDIKVNFPEPEAADCFNSFVPEIIKNMSSSKLQLNNIKLILDD